MQYAEPILVLVPDDIWQIVFSYISIKDLLQTSYVCKLWNKFAWSTKRRELNFQGLRLRKNDKIWLERLLRAFPNLKELNCKHYGGENFVEFNLDIIARCCTELEVLSLEGCRKVRVFLRFL